MINIKKGSDPWSSSTRELLKSLTFYDYLFIPLLEQFWLYLVKELRNGYFWSKSLGICNSKPFSLESREKLLYRLNFWQLNFLILALFLGLGLLDQIGMSPDIHDEFIKSHSLKTRLVKPEPESHQFVIEVFWWLDESQIPILFWSLLFLYQTLLLVLIQWLEF